MIQMYRTHLRNALLFKLDERAVTAIEYAIIASLIAVVIVGGVTLIGKNLSNTFNKVASEL